MTREQLISFLEGQGYKSYPVPRIESDGVVWTGSKRLPEGSSECDTNEKKISYHVRVWDWAWGVHQEYRQQVLDIEIVAEKHDQWATLKSYGIPWDKVEKQLSVAEKCLLNAWEAFAGMGKEIEDALDTRD